MSRDEVETEGDSSATSPWSITKQRGPERQRTLTTWVFGVSLLVHASAAFGLHARASEPRKPVPQQVEIELAPPPPPPPPPPPEPEPEPEPEPPPKNTPPPPKQPPKPQPKPQAAKPRPSNDAPPPEASTNLPSSAEGTLPPAPPGPVNNPAPPPPPPPPAPPPVVEAKEGANYKNNPRPGYPRLALREGWEGKVVLRVKVLPDGKVGGASVLKSAGRTVLDDAALEIVKSWTFVPATQGGRPIAGFVSVPFEFKIN